MSVDCVADLSHTAGWFQPTQSHADGVRLLKRHLAAEVNLICPSIWIYEVLNLLAVAVRRGRLSDELIAAARQRSLSLALPK